MAADRPPYITIEVEHFLSLVLGKDSTHGVAERGVHVGEGTSTPRSTLGRYVALNARTSKDHLDECCGALTGWRTLS